MVRLYFESDLPADTTLQWQQTTAVPLPMQSQLVHLWNAEFPHLLSYPSVKDFADYLAQLADVCHTLALNAAQDLVGWLAVFTRDHTRHFVMLVRRDYQQRGVGSELLKRAKANETELYGWAIDHAQDQKSDGTPYRTPINFYRKNGFTIRSEVRQDTDRLSTVRICWTASV